MILPEFHVLAPESMFEVLDLLDGYGPEGAMVLAGGTDLLVRMKDGSARPSTVIVLDKVPELDAIEMTADKIRIGAKATFDQVISSDIIRDYAPVLWCAAQNMGSPQLRNRATIGGNICNGSPCADSLPPLYVLGAAAILQSASGERRLPIEKCFKGPKETAFYRNELLTAVEFAIPAQPENSFFLASGQRRALAITKISVAGQFRFVEGVMQEARIAYGSVAPTVLRGAAVEEYLQWQSLSPEAIQKAVSLCRKEIKPIDDIRSTAEWRREATGVLLQRGLESLAEKNQPPAQI